MMEELLRMEGISKQFGEFYANRNVNFDVRAGEVHTLLGENGAGKSTLMNVLIGLYQPSAGDIYLHGQKVKIESPAQAVKLGIGMVHQHFMKAVEDGSFGNQVVYGTLDNNCIYLGAFNNSLIDSATQAKITDAVKLVQSGTFGK